MKEIKSNILDLTKLDPDNSRLVDNIAEIIRREYVNYLIKIGKDNKKNIDWWVLNFVSRNTLISQLFRDICFLTMLKKRLKEGHLYDEIIIDSLALKKAIKKNFYKYHFKVNYKGRSVLHTYLGRINSYFKVFKQISSRFLAAWLTRKYKRIIKTDRVLTLLDVFIFRNSFDKGIYLDRYYPKLLEYIDSNEKEYTYYVPTFYGLKKYKKVFTEMRKSKQNFLVKEDYLKLKDYLFALLYPLRLNKLKIKYRDFLGLDIYPLIREEMTNDRVSHSSIYSLLNYRFSRRLKENGIKLRIIVNWFENQIIDHGFNSGFRRYYPESKLIGYLGVPLLDNFLSLFSTEQERICAVIPEEINVIGNGYINMVKEFCPDLQVKVAPAFRYSEVWNKRNYFPDKHKCSILVALPILIDESDEIIDIVLEAACSINIKNCIFKIKPHPTHDIKNISDKWSKRLPEMFKFVDGDFNSCVEKSDILISSASTVCLETLARGIPVIVIGNSSGLTQLSIPRSISEDIWKLCYSVNDVIEAIKLYSKKDNKTVNMYKKIGRGIRDNFFEPVIELGARKFLSL
ncbi:hypothetical protein ES708_04865 [subsurface metagenome]